MKKNIGLLIIPLLCLMACETKETENPLLQVNFNFEDRGAEGWIPNFPDSWEVTDLDGSKVYALTASGVNGEVAAPKSWSVIADYDMASFEFSGRLKCMAEIDNPNRDLCIFFGEGGRQK